MKNDGEAITAAQRRLDRSAAVDDAEDYIGEDTDDLTPGDYRKAVSVLTGRAVDLVEDEEMRFYACMKLCSQLGIKE